MNQKALIAGMVAFILIMAIGTPLELAHKKKSFKGPWLVRSRIGNQMVVDFMATNPSYVTVEWHTNIDQRGIVPVGIVKTNRF